MSMSDPTKTPFAFAQHLSELRERFEAERAPVPLNDIRGCGGSVRHNEHTTVTANPSTEDARDPYDDAQWPLLEPWMLWARHEDGDFFVKCSSTSDHCGECAFEAGRGRGPLRLALDLKDLILASLGESPQVEGGQWPGSLHDQFPALLLIIRTRNLAVVARRSA